MGTIESGAGVKALLWGLGAMGGGMAEMILTKKGIEIVAAIAKTQAKAGKDLGDALGFGTNVGVVVTNDPEKAFRSAPDVALISTASFVKDVAHEIKFALSHGADVICIAEEMAYPWEVEPELSREIDGLARKVGKTVLGTGINPGFVLDTLVLALTGICKDVKSIHARRVNDLAPFGRTVMMTQGVGVTPDGFRQGLKSGEIVGHVGFGQSISLIAQGLGWKIDKVVEEREPIVSQTERKTPHAHVMPGNVAGCNHTARAYMGDREVIVLEHPQQICPHLEGIATGDYITIDGVPPVNLEIKPEIPGGVGTVAVAVNMIPLVLQARPGLLTMADLPVPRAMIGQVAAAPQEEKAGAGK